MIGRPRIPLPASMHLVGETRHIQVNHCPDVYGATRMRRGRCGAIYSRQVTKPLIKLTVWRPGILEGLKNEDVPEKEG